MLLFVLQLRCTFGLYHNALDRELYKDFNDFVYVSLSFTFGFVLNCGNVYLSILAMPKYVVVIAVSNIILNCIGLIYKLDLHDN